MQTFNKVMLVLLVVAFPLASWYYLNTGLNFRKKALKDLTPKGLFITKDSILTDLISQKTAIIFRDSKLEKDMKVIHNQYKESKTFTLVQIGQNTEIDEPTWLKYNLAQIVSDSMFNNDKAVILIDTAFQIRYVYNVNNFEPGRLVEHISIVLPREQEPDIKVRQNAGE